MPKIDICICTDKRPKLLIDCLQSLESILVPSGAEVTVIDNDQTGSTGATELTEIFTFNIYYHYKDKVESHVHGTMPLRRFIAREVII